MLGFGNKSQSGPERPKTALPRLETGVARLDFILNGGFLRGGIYVVMGNPGTGKTILANQTAFHVVREAPANRCVYVTLLVESVTKMFAHLSSLDFFEPNLAPDRLTYVSGYSILKSEGLPGILKLLRTMVNDHRPQLLVIDGLQTIASAAENEGVFKEFLHELQAFTHLLGTTTMCLTQSDLDTRHPETTVVDGVLELCDKLGLDLRYDAFLQKPFDLATLQREVARFTPKTLGRKES